MKFIIFQLWPSNWGWQFVDHNEVSGLTQTGYADADEAQEGLVDLLTVFKADIDSVEIEVRQPEPPPEEEPPGE